jgi:hypothetical protein
MRAYLLAALDSRSAHAVPPREETVHSVLEALGGWKLLLLFSQLTHVSVHRKFCRLLP